MENLNKYSLEEFILNPSFQNYVLKTNSSDETWWENYFKDHPDQITTAEKATQIILLLTKARKPLPSTKEQDYKKLMQSIERQERSNTIFQAMMPSGYYRIAKIAAVLLVFVIIGGLAGNLITKHLSNTNSRGICTTVVGKGQKSKVFLPDGTEVWLNSESSLSYSIDFGASTRDVKLTGEAYFKVKKDKSHQFIVHTSDVDVKVYGTEFNIKSYADENMIETTLVSGSLSIEKVSGKKTVEPLFLKPNQRVVIYKGNIPESDTETNYTGKENKIVTRSNISTVNSIIPESIHLYNDIDVEKEISWKDQKLIFKDETFENLAKMFERWYDVKIVFESSDISKLRYRGSFENQTIEQALNAMRYTTPFDFSVDHRTIHIMPKGEKK